MKLSFRYFEILLLPGQDIQFCLEGNNSQGAVKFECYQSWKALENAQLGHHCFNLELKISHMAKALRIDSLWNYLYFFLIILKPFFYRFEFDTTIFFPLLYCLHSAKYYLNLYFTLPPYSSLYYIPLNSITSHQSNCCFC